MKLRRTVHTLKGPPDITPLVDVALLLLIFFLLTSSFVFQPGIKIELPRAMGSGGVSARYIVGIVERESSLIFFNDQLVELEQLRERFEQIARREANASIVIKADRDARHGLVTQVIDAAAQAGLPVIIATLPEDEPQP